FGEGVSAMVGELVVDLVCRVLVEEEGGEVVVAEFLDGGIAGGGSGGVGRGTGGAVGLTDEGGGEAAGGGFGAGVVDGLGKLAVPLLMGGERWGGGRGEKEGVVESEFDFDGFDPDGGGGTGAVGFLGEDAVADDGVAAERGAGVGRLMAGEVGVRGRGF